MLPDVPSTLPRISPPNCPANHISHDTSADRRIDAGRIEPLWELVDIIEGLDRVGAKGIPIGQLTPLLQAPRHTDACELKLGNRSRTLAFPAIT
jgi:hypothetical protein